MLQDVPGGNKLKTIGLSNKNLYNIHSLHGLLSQLDLCTGPLNNYTRRDFCDPGHTSIHYVSLRANFRKGLNRAYSAIHSM